MSGQMGCYYFDHRVIDRSLAVSFDSDLREYGPDRGSYYFSPGLVMAHRACQFDDLSASEAQPYVLSTNIAITFDGRLDNRSCLITWLRDTLSGDLSDVALAGAAYERWGEDGFARLVGDWSLCLWDGNSKTLLLASDYCGVRPLYYSILEQEGVYWSSSLRSLVDRTDSAQDLDESWIAAFLTARPKFDHTVYRRIRSVPPAHCFKVSGVKCSIRRFWSPGLRNRIRYQRETEYEEHLQHHFREAVAVRLRTNRPVSCELSGGLDSSLVACVAHELLEAGTVQVPRLIAFTELDHHSDDERYAREVQALLGIEHICCDMGPFWSLGPGQVTPCSSMARTQLKATLLLEQGVRVNLTGVTGDLAMGNEIDDSCQIADEFGAGHLGEGLASAYRWSRALRVPIYDVVARALVPFLTPERQIKAWRRASLRQANLYAHTEHRLSCLASCVSARVSESWSGGAELCRWRDALPSLRKFIAMLEFQNLGRRLETRADLLPVTDSHPYAHRPLIEYLCAIPREVLCRPGQRRYLMRKTFARLLPAGVASRKNKALMGYQHYIEARQLIQRLPREANEWEVVARGWVDPAPLSDALSQVTRGTLHEWSEITKILMLETWFVSQRTKEYPPSAGFAIGFQVPSV